MKNIFVKGSLCEIILLSICFLFYSSIISAQAPVFNSVSPNTTTPALFDKFELDIHLTATFTNAYDYDHLNVKCIFNAPGGRKDTVDGFFMQDYILNTDGSVTASGIGSFKVRYAPNETGTWSYTLSCKDTMGTTIQPSQNFLCISSPDPGFIRKNASNYLNFDNGNQYIPIGENMGWQDNNVVTDYTNWLNKLASNSGNFIRVWMSSWAFALEWKNGSNGFSGIKNYKQTSAYYLDWLLDYCKQKDVYVMLALNNHGQVSSTVNPEWVDNPYNFANGGPAMNTWDFFTNPVAKAFHKNRLRYILARWGYSKNIMCWELFNEVDWTDNFNTYKDNVKDWHLEMADYLKSKDVYKHLVTTSYANNAYDPNTWNGTSIDFTQTHNYIGSPNLESALAGACSDYVAQYNKPTLDGEFGIDASNSSLSTIDPNGIYVHNSIWATAFSGAMGTGMTWWWDTYVDPQNLYIHFKALSQFISTLSLVTDNYKKVTASSSGGGTSDLVLTPGIGFATAGASAFTIDASGAITPSASQLSNYLFGNSFNTQYRSPPTFTVTYPVAGQFKVITGATAGTSPKINIYLDAVSMVDQAGAINSTYSINVPAGAHTIKVDNLGTDWISISSYTFTNIGSALNTYILKSADSKKSAGWVHNKKYNWQYVKDNGAPPIVSGASVIIPGMQNGSYMVQLTNCTSGASLGTVNATASGGNLVIPLPAIAWDISLSATWGGVTPVSDLALSHGLKIYPNPVVHDRLYLSYNLERASPVNIDIMDIAGKRLAVIFNGEQSPGSKSLDWDPSTSGISSGLYLLRFAINKEIFSQKIIVLK